MTGTRVLRWASRRPSALPLVIALVMFGQPLFVGLDKWDLDNDEAIYSYSVDRILETGEWLTPRSIMVDGPFLEKPPLKTWIVAAGITLGLPHDEAGLRFFDALFGLAAFAYVFVIGRRLSGWLCGFTALFFLHTCWPLVFEHGLRTNNMEAALVLTYCGGVYHFFGWTEAVTGRQRRMHAWMVTLFFVFGFLIKFVAALFLPVVLATAFLWQGEVRSRLRAGWLDWVLPAVAAVVLIAPWFVYESFVQGRHFWQTILGEHVIQRFTSHLFPTHVQPWHFYFTRTFTSAGQPPFPLFLSIVGLAVLVWRAWMGQPMARPPGAGLVDRAVRPHLTRHVKAVSLCLPVLRTTGPRGRPRRQRVVRRGGRMDRQDAGQALRTRDATRVATSTPGGRVPQPGHRAVVGARGSGDDPGLRRRSCSETPRSRGPPLSPSCCSHSPARRGRPSGWPRRSHSCSSRPWRTTVSCTPNSHPSSAPLVR